MSNSAPRSIEQYLQRLSANLADEDPAVIQDALHDAEEYLRAEVMEHPDKSEGDVVELVASTYGNPDEVAEVYRQTEATVNKALAPPKRRERSTKSGSFFSILSDPTAYSALFYMILSLLTGILFFTVTVTGISLSLGLAITIIGLPFFLLFVSIERALSLMEGRIVETLLGIRMPRRPPYTQRQRPFLERLKDMLKDSRTWSTMAYMVLKLPLGVAYFVIAVTGTTLAIALLLSPLALLLEPLGLGGDGTTNLWLTPIAFVVGLVLAPSMLYFAKWVGKWHGELAKSLLVKLA
jgi:uncharacterized membrane protein